MPTTVYLVTGANRSLGSSLFLFYELLLTIHSGLALVNEIASRHSDVAIFAGARNPDAAASLKELQVKYPGKINVVKFVSGDIGINYALVKVIEEQYGYIDIVIANAGKRTV